MAQIVPQAIKDALAGGPWWVQSTTIRGLVLCGAGVVGHLTGSKVRHDTIEVVCDTLTFIGIGIAGYGRSRKEKQSAVAEVVAAQTGSISLPAMKAIAKSDLPLDISSGKHNG